MKVIIAGSRSITDLAAIFRCIDQSIPDPGVVSEVISGCAKGVDTAGEKWAEEHGIPVSKFPAQWNYWGAQAGIVRNIEMAKYACDWKETEDYAIQKKQASLVLVWDGCSKGSAHMLRTARRYGLDVFENILEDCLDP